MEFVQSAERFVNWALAHQDRDRDILAVVEHSFEGGLRWVALAPRFWDQLEALLPEPVANTAARKTKSISRLCVF